MSDDLVRRLREWTSRYPQRYDAPLMVEAAKRIEWLESIDTKRCALFNARNGRIEALEAALREIADMDGHWRSDCRGVALRALETKHE